MLACVAAGGLAFNVPSFSALERTLFSANREAEGLLRRLRRAESNGEDALSRLQQSDHVLTPGSAILITGASDGLGKEAARALACDFGYPCILAVRDIQKGEEAASSCELQARLHGWRWLSWTSALTRPSRQGQSPVKRLLQS